MPNIAGSKQNTSSADANATQDWLEAAHASAAQLGPEPVERANWLVKQCLTHFDPAVLMMAGEIGKTEIRESQSNSFLSRSAVTQLRQEIWKSLQEVVEDEPDARVQIRRVDGKKYAILSVPIVSSFDDGQFGTLCLAIDCPAKSEIQTHLIAARSVVRAAFSLWNDNESVPKERELTAPQKSPERSPEKNEGSSTKPRPRGVAQPESNSRKPELPRDSGPTPSTRKKLTSTSPENTQPETPTDSNLQSSEQAVAAHKAGQFESHIELAYELANSVANRFQCEQVGVGIARGKRIQIAAVSGLATVKANSPGALLMRQAMEECLDQNKPVAFPSPAIESELVASGIHQMWSKSAGNSQVYSLPLHESDGKCAAVLSLRLPKDQTLDEPALVQLNEIVRPFGPGIKLLMRASRGLRAHFGDVLLNSKNHLRSKPMQLIGVLLFAAFLLWCDLGQLPYEPTCNAQVTSGSVRHVTAPMDGRLQEVFVKEGEQFEAGDCLLQFATEKLELQKNLLVAELGEVSVDFKQAIADKEPRAIALKRAKMEVIRAKIQGAEQQLRQATIYAEEAGSVSHHDLRKSIGQEFQFGAPMMELAIGNVWDLEIEVPDNTASYIAEGQIGSFSPVGRPMDVIPFKIDAVRGLAEVRNGKNVFVARARLDASRDWMRGGMKGTAKITTESKPVYWVLFRDAIDWLHATLWF